MVLTKVQPKAGGTGKRVRQVLARPGDFAAGQGKRFKLISDEDSAFSLQSAGDFEPNFPLDQSKHDEDMQPHEGLGFAAQPKQPTPTKSKLKK